jgi:signal transduction histidine kinase
MNAQEKERARLARELHDDLSQSLALLSIQLHSIASGDGDKDTFSSQLGNITYQIDRLSSDVHRISHQLHPAKLEQLGLVSALRGFCREIGHAHEIKIDFHDENTPTTLPNDVSLCLYRVAQESLQNVVKHSGASNVTVDLIYLEGEVSLSIADNGAGFDTAHEDSREGIGLISMKERLRVVDGRVRIDSTVGSGTKVVVMVPIERQPKVVPSITTAGLVSFIA